MNAKNIAAVAAGLNLVPDEGQNPSALSHTRDCSPSCPECNGVGYIRFDVPVEHPKFGKVERCPNARARTQVKSLQVGEIDPRVGLTADEVRNLTWNLVKKGVNQADQACEITKCAYTSGHGMVFMYGGYGQGKSLVLKIAVAAALNEGKRAAYANLAGVSMTHHVADRFVGHLAQGLVCRGGKGHLDVARGVDFDGQVPRHMQPIDHIDHALVDALLLEVARFQVVDVAANLFDNPVEILNHVTE